MKHRAAKPNTWSLKSEPRRIHRTHPSNLGIRTHLLEPWRLDSIRRLIQDDIGLQMHPSKEGSPEFGSSNSE
ncbi:hypothetical protein AMECASPLE_010660 [Ameca splendens]|uniref:Uncharacterized protein n=1 Tax=Ameca splendens TaxID=208324 RepID=A0ABV1A909_9TELE